jgi:hypothetical protein
MAAKRFMAHQTATPTEQVHVHDRIGDTAVVRIGNNSNRCTKLPSDYRTPRKADELGLSRSPPDGYGTGGPTWMPPGVADEIARGDDEDGDCDRRQIPVL